MPPINFRPVEKRHFTDEGIAEFQNMWREVVQQVNNLTGVNGPIQLLNHIDLGGNRVMNVGAPPAGVTTDALSQQSADPKYSTAVQQKHMEALGVKMLQTTRRLGDGTQQHKISSDLNQQGSIPPTLSGPTSYTSTATSITVTYPATIQYSDQSVISIPPVSLVVTGLTAGNYFMYPYYDTSLGLGQLVADSTNGVGVPPCLFSALNINAAQTQNGDGHVPLSNGAVAVTVVASGGGSGGGSGCIRTGMMIRSKTRGVIPIDAVIIGEEIQSRSGWTMVRQKRIGRDTVFIRLMLSNGESLQVTATHPLALFSGEDKPAGELCLGDLLTMVDEREQPLQILELSVVQHSGGTVLLSCEPHHDYMVGSSTPCVVAHNAVPLK